jgi:hypothetical protein
MPSSAMVRNGLLERRGLQKLSLSVAHVSLEECGGNVETEVLAPTRVWRPFATLATRRRFWLKKLLASKGEFLGVCADDGEPQAPRRRFKVRWAEVQVKVERTLRDAFSMRRQQKASSAENSCRARLLHDINLAHALSPLSPSPASLKLRQTGGKGVALKLQNDARLSDDRLDISTRKSFRPARLPSLRSSPVLSAISLDLKSMDWTKQALTASAHALTGLDWTQRNNFGSVAADWKCTGMHKVASDGALVKTNKTNMNMRPCW